MKGPLLEVSLLIGSCAMDLQALIMGTLVAMGATARFTGPLWGKKLSSVGVYNNVNVCCSPANAAYLAADHHVYIVMNILSVSILLVMVPFILLYRTMKPATQQQQLTISCELVAAIRLNSILTQDTVELVSREKDTVELVSREKEFVSLENGGEKDSGSRGEREVEGRRKGRRKVASDKTQLLDNTESSSDDEEEL